MNPSLPPRPVRPPHPAADAFGLIAWLEETRVVLPLKAVDVHFSVSGDLAEVSLDQVFHQTVDRPLDVLYTFPLPGGAAVFRCELIVNDRVIAARVEEQARAKEIARQMKAEGQRVGLVEVERDNLFTLSLGNVQPGDLVIVRFAWFQVLDHAQDMKSLLVPFTPGVRYIPGRPLLRSNRGKGVDDDTDQVPDASRLSPPRIDDLHPDAALLSIEGAIDGRFVQPGSVASATHPLLVREEAGALLVSLPREGHVPDRDFVLRWTERATEALELKSISCADADAQYAVVRLDAPKGAPVAESKGRDYYFLVDRSGSMQGAKWTCTARALNAFLDEIGESDRVWVTLFESTFQDFAEAPLPVAELKSDRAFRSLEKLGTAGGTELLPALKHVLEVIAAHSKERAPVVILITDGQVGNEAGVLDALRAHRQLPVHTFGIDTAVNDAFLKHLAAQHRGGCMLMTPNDDIRGAVTRLGARLRRPVLVEIAASGGWQAATAQVPDVHADEHLLVALKGPKGAAFLELTGTLADRSRRTFRFDLRPEKIASPRLLWAREAIDLHLAEHREKEALALAMHHNIVCRGAAFIAYDEKVPIANEELYQPAMEGIVLRIQLGVPRAIAAAACAPMPPDGAPGRAFGAPLSVMRKSVRDHVGGALRNALDFLAPAKPIHPISADKDQQRLDEIRARHLRTPGRPNVRIQLQLEGWSQAMTQMRAFQSNPGKVLIEVLRRWAAQDVPVRLPLLEAVARELAQGDPRAVIADFARDHIADKQLGEDVAWLAAQLGA